MFNALTVTSLVSLALLLPTSTALPFNLNNLWKSKSFVAPSYAGDDRPGHWHPSATFKSHSTYTLTTSTGTSYPTVHAALASGLSGATGTGTAAYPTGTSYAKRAHHSGHSSGSAASTVASTGAAYELLWYDYPSVFPTSFPTASSSGTAGIKVYVVDGTTSTSASAASATATDHARHHGGHRHGGPRKGDQPHYYPSAQGYYAASAVANVLVATGTSAPTVTAATTTAPCTETAYPTATGTS